MSSNRIGLRVVDQYSEHTAALGQVPNPLALFFIDSLVDERHQVVSTPPHAQRPVTRVDKLDGGVHDRAQRGVEVELRCNHQHGLDQAVKPVAPLDDLRDAFLDLGQQLPQPQLRQRIA